MRNFHLVVLRLYKPQKIKIGHNLPRLTLPWQLILTSSVFHLVHLKMFDRFLLNVFCLQHWTCCDKMFKTGLNKLYRRLECAVPDNRNVVYC